MTWSETFHCQSKAHCTRCRSLEVGRPFRISILSAFQVPGDSPDFPCPAGHPWGYVAPPPATPVDITVRGILALPEDTNGRFLRSMAAQIQALIKENRGGSCQDKHAYRRRLEAKLLYYWETYGPAANRPSTMAHV